MENINCINFLVQSMNAGEEMQKAYSKLLNTSKELGADLNNVMPDSCDITFPDKKSAEIFQSLIS
jgi:hypothetical protein